MPISGSYNFPFVQTPNSSYPTVDLRTFTGSPGVSSNIAKIFYSGSSIYSLLADGTLLNLGSSGSSGTSPVTGSDTFATNLVYSPAQHLVLSSSIGSTVAVSGNFKVIGPSPLIYSDTSRLVLSSSAGGVLVSGSLKIASGAFFPMVTPTSTAPSVVIDGTVTDMGWGSNAGAGIVCIVNGTARWIHEAGAIRNSAGTVTLRNATPSLTANILGLALVNPGLTTGLGGVAATGHVSLICSGTAMMYTTNTVGDFVFTTGSTGGQSTKLIASGSHLILSSTVGSRVTISGTATITGLPSGDPGVPGALYHTAGAVMVSL